MTPIAELDRLIHEPVRLHIIHALSLNAALTFHELKERLGTSDGNLSVHAQRLEEAGYISCVKYFTGRVPTTEYRLSPRGKQATERYLDQMASLLHATRTALFTGHPRR